MQGRFVFLALASCAIAVAGLAIPRRMDGYAIGSPSAPVLLELVGDTMCSDTKAAYPTIRAVADAYGPDQLRLVFHAQSHPSTHASWLTNLGLMVVADNDASDAYPFIELIFANQDNYFNSAVHANSTDQIVASVGGLVADAGFMTADAFVAGMNNASIQSDGITSWEYIVSRGAGFTPTFFVNGVTVDADPTWTVDDWKQVLDPLFSQPVHRPSALDACKAEIARIRTYSSPPTCPPNNTLCQYLPGHYQCCKPTIYCIPNVGCECSQPKECTERESMPVTSTDEDATCPSGEKVCNYLPGKSMCCVPGEYCIKNVGCTCSMAHEPAPQVCKPQRKHHVPKPRGSCPAGEKVCNYLPGKSMCCSASEYCIKNVGCTC